MKLLEWAQHSGRIVARAANLLVSAGGVRSALRLGSVLGCVLGLAALTSQSSAANPLKSLYTTIDLKSCSVLRKHADGNAWLCPGLEGYPVYVAEGDLRTFVSVGPNPERRRAATQTLAPHNTLFRGKSNRATLEWRITRRNGKPVPHATIQRFFTQQDGKAGEVLVITKLTQLEDCHVAYVDALANPQAIALARSIADGAARKFDCSNEPAPSGQTGRSPM